MTLQEFIRPTQPSCNALIISDLRPLDGDARSNRAHLTCGVFFAAFLLIILCVFQTATAATGLGVIPAGISFGNVTIGTNSTQTITLRNLGITSIGINKASITGTGFSLSGLSLPRILSAGGTISCTVKFAPSTTGSFTGSLSIVSTASSSATAVPLSGSGQSGAVVTLSPASLSFGNNFVGTTSAVQTVTLTTGRIGALSITSIALSGANASDFAQTNTCASSLAAGANCAIHVTFTPSEAGNRTASLSITDNAGGSHQNVPLSGTGVVQQLTVSPSSISFGNVKLNATELLPVVVNNNGTTSVTISNFTVTGSSFKVSGLTLPFTLSGGTNTTFNVGFTPTTTGSASGTVTVVSSVGTPSISVTGAGSNSTASNNGCIGAAISQTPIDVTSDLSNVAAGITVTQLTTNGTAWNTYADIPAVSSPGNLLTYNYGTNPAQVATANLDGTDAQVVSGSSQGTQVQVTGDGQYIYYEGQNSNSTSDIYAVPVLESGACQQIRLSDLNMKFIAPAQALIISTSSFNPATSHNVIAFSEGLILHRVEDDGTALPDLTLPDPENTDVFHRMRLNPVFPNILWYKRDQPAPNPNGVAQPEIWIVDLNNPTVAYSLMASAGNNPGVDHAAWSNDGRELGFINGGYWWVSNVVNPNGTLNIVKGAIPLPSGWTTNKPLGPPASSGLTVDFCTLSPDSSVYVCAQGHEAIYLMSLDGTQTEFLTSPDSSPTGAIYNGIPKPRFLDMEHIIFSSDRTGTPEVYVIAGFTTTFP